MNTEMITEMNNELCTFQDGVCVTPYDIMMRNKCIKLCLKWMLENGVNVPMPVGGFNRYDATEEEVDEWNTLYKIYHDTIWMYAEDVLKYGTDDECKIMILDWINACECEWDENTKKIVDMDLSI